MLTRSEILNNPSNYSVDELYRAIKGIDIDERVTMQELCAAGLFYQIRVELQKRLDTDNRIEEQRKQVFRYAKEHADVGCIRQFFLEHGDYVSGCDDKVWEVVETIDTISAYEFYINCIDEFHLPGNYIFIAKSKLEEKRRAREERRMMLFEDMKKNPNSYDFGRVKAILDPEGTIRDNDVRFPNWRNNPNTHGLNYTYGHCLEWKDMNVTENDLVVNGVIPDNRKIKRSMVKPDTELQQRTIGEFSGSMDGRTDVYMIGIPRSGKSCVLGALVARGYEKATLMYVPYFIEGQNGRYDPYRQYYQDLINAFDDCNPPQSTVTYTLALMQVDVESKRMGVLGREIIEKHPLTLFEIGGEAFESATINVGDCFWKSAFASKTVYSKNRKVLFFIVDYLQTQDTEQDKQDKQLYDILLALQQDGENDGRGGFTKNCTMSKVDQCVILLTKCDLMEDEDREKRRDNAISYVKNKLTTFRSSLEKLSKEYGINNGRGVRVMTFSLGKYYIGNSFEFDPTDADYLIEFFRNNTRIQNKL